MTIEKLQRVMWRVRKESPGTNTISYIVLRRAIMRECGTHPSTYFTNRKALVTLGWIKSFNSKRVILTNKDLQES